MNLPITITPPPKCDHCPALATVAYGYGWGRDCYGCAAHNPMAPAWQTTAAATPAGFWLRTITPLPPFVPYTTGPQVLYPRQQVVYPGTAG